MSSILDFVMANSAVLLSLVALVASVFSIVSHKLTKNTIDDKIADAVSGVLGKFGVKVPGDESAPKA